MDIDFIEGEYLFYKIFNAMTNMTRIQKPLFTNRSEQQKTTNPEITTSKFLKFIQNVTKSKKPPPQVLTHL